jgi:YggT family protein
LDLLFRILDTFLLIMTFLIIGRALLSWFDPRGATPIGRFLFEATEPIIAPIRSVMPRTGMLDLSPMIAVFLIILLRQMLQRAVA